jgi:hypothetical protein
MTGQLRERLAELGEQMPPARLPADLWRRGRRRRRREVARGLAAALAAVAVVAVALPTLNGGAGGSAPAAAQPSVPGTLRLPWPWQATVRQDPRGPATLLFSGDSAGLADIQDKVAVYGRDGSYRMLRYGAPDPIAGEVVRLSPDGRYVAHAGLSGAPEDWLQITDLTTGRTRAYAGPDGVHCCAVPAAWSPDGRLLLAVDHRDAIVYEPPRYDRQPARLAVLDVTSGRAERLLDLEDDRWWLRSPSVAAWHPDGSRFVVEAEGEFVTVARDGRVLAREPRPPDVRLAGPAAFAPDGRRYLVAENLGCALICGQEELSRRRWAVRFADAPGGYAEVQAAAVRVVGWRGEEPVLVAYRPDPEAAQDTVHPNGDVDQTLVDTVRLLALPPGGRPPRVLLDPPDEVAGLDVAADLVAAGRFGGAPSRPGLWPAGPLLLVPLGLVAALVAGAAAGRYARRRWRRQRVPR